MPLRLVPRTAVVPVLGGENRGRRWIVGSGVHGYWIGHYERRHQQLLARLIKQDGVFFDVGAHVGFYSLMASRRVGPDGRVVAFEPNPRNIAYLRRHVEINGATNVEIVQAAVSESDAWVGFEAPGDSSMGHVRDGVGTSVRSVTLDRWVDEHDFLPTVVKIDVEGHEAPVLAGATNVLSQFRPTIVLSVGPESLGNCRAILDAHGYRMDALGSSIESSTEFACFPLPRHRRSD